MGMQSGVKVKIDVFIDTTRLSFREKLVLLGKVGAAIDRGDAAELVSLGKTEALDMKEVKRRQAVPDPVAGARPDDADEPADEPTQADETPVEDGNDEPAFVPGQRRHRTAAAE